MVHISFSGDLHIHPFGQRIYYRRTHTVKSAAGFVYRIIKFAAGMKSRKYKPGCRHTFFMHSHRNTASVIFDSTGAILMKGNGNSVTESGQMFVYCIIHDLIDQMIKSFSRSAADIHTRSFPNSLQSFQNRNAAGIIVDAFCHTVICPFPQKICELSEGSDSPQSAYTSFSHL